MAIGLHARVRPIDLAQMKRRAESRPRGWLCFTKTRLRASQSALHFWCDLSYVNAETLAPIALTGHGCGGAHLLLCGGEDPGGFRSVPTAIGIARRTLPRVFEVKEIDLNVNLVWSCASIFCLSHAYPASEHVNSG